MAAKSTKPVAKKKTAAGVPKKPVKTIVFIDKIITAPAESVRARRDPDAVERYAEVYKKKNGELPPVDVFQGKSKCYLGEGGHRVLAKLSIGHASISAFVYKFATDEAAEEAAYKHAAAANHEHGLPRSDDDKRATVKSMIVRPEYASISDTALGELCNVGHVLIRLVREQLSASGLLTGEASAESRKYKPDAKLRGGSVADGKGGFKPVGTSPGPKDDQKSTPDDSPEPVARPESETPSADSEAEPEKKPRAKPDGQVRDAVGRIVPATLIDAFTEASALVADTKETLSAVWDAIQAASMETWGKAVAGVLQPMELDFRNIRENFFGALPHVVCPHVREDGTHVQPGKCKVCSDQGFGTKHRYQQWTDELKLACRDWAERDGVEVAEAA